MHRPPVKSCCRSRWSCRELAEGRGERSRMEPRAGKKLAAEAAVGRNSGREGGKVDGWMDGGKFGQKMHL